MKKLVIIITLILNISTVTSYAFQISSGYGWRINPITHKKEFHTGIDIPGNQGTPITALFDGEVVLADWYKGYGLTVILHHSINNSYTLYGHCSKINVFKGQTVVDGQIIALVGSTGLSTGPHLHLSYWIDNQYLNPLLIWENKQNKKNNECNGINSSFIAEKL